MEVSPVLTGGKEVKPLHLKDTGKDTVFPGRGGSQFAKWWVSRSEAPAPRTAQEFMQLVEYVGKPYEIEVKVGGKYDIVNDYKF